VPGRDSAFTVSRRPVFLIRARRATSGDVPAERIAAMYFDTTVFGLAR
jgi:hypothetical protein